MGIVGQITRATEAAAFPRQHLGLSLREVHLDQWSITEVLRLHLEGSGGYRGWNLQNWRHNNRGGFKLQDDPGFQFCLDEPQIIGSLREKSVFELNVSEKLKILMCMVNQMLSFAGVRDEIDTRNENVWETRVELRRCRADENKRIKALMKHKDGWPFERPITKQEAPDYLLCVKTPMDLSTIRSRMDGNIYYSRNQEILDDIRLVFSNCFQYNQEDTEEYKCAVRLEKYFDKELDRVGMIDENQYPKAPKSKKRRA